ncbi:MAG: OmpA family protein [Saprospiraceae bacterium]|nr:OmpA family protein [Saprospiraceae bacterium]
MAKRLTTFSKFVITLVIVAGVFFGGKYILQNTEFGQNLLNKSDNPENPKKDNPKPSGNTDVISVGVVTWGGYAGGQYFNEGFDANTNSRFYKDYGFEVEFKVLDDFDASRAAWKRDEVQLLWCTIDAFPTEVNALKDFDPVVVWQADWSRGGDAIVARRGINSVADLRGKRIAVAELSPSHSFLIWLLDAGGLSVNDVEIVPQSSAIDAAEVFKSQRVDAAVVWSPDDEACLRAVAGSSVLESTRSASNIIADVFIAKRSFVEANKDKMRQMYEGWMRGSAEINSSDANKRKAAQILSENFPGFTVDDTYQAINNVRLTTHGDNQNFFGLDPNFRGVNGNSLYTRMANVYRDLGYIEGSVPNWRLIAMPELVESTNLSGSQHEAEGTKEFSELDDQSGRDAEAIASKQVRINFRTAEYILDENAKYIIDKEFVEIAKAFANARIRIEGNTDSQGSRSTNIALSKKRAEAVRDYLVEVHNMPRNRFIVIGNGPDKPLASNDTESGRAQNRRTDFELVRE